MRFRQTRSLDGAAIRSATFSREGPHGYVSLLVDDAVESPAVHGAPGSAVGVDRGVVVAVATSGGELLDRPFVTAGEQRRAAVLQRRLSCAVKGSANRNKTRAALANVRARERHRRQDFCRKTAHQLVHANAVVVLEKLPAKNMTRRAQPVVDPNNPGGFLPTGAAAESGLNKAILSKGWYRFEQALKSVSR